MNKVQSCKAECKVIITTNKIKQKDKNILVNTLLNIKYFILIINKFRLYTQSICLNLIKNPLEIVL